MSLDMCESINLHLMCTNLREFIYMHICMHAYMHSYMHSYIHTD
jgi:hypothetical protein